MIDFKIIKNWESKLKCLDFVIFLAKTQNLTNQKKLFLCVLFVKKLNLAHTALNNFKQSSADMRVGANVRFLCLLTSKYHRNETKRETQK